MRVAAIDCGTNSIRLLIADVEGSHLTDIVRVMKVVRLGEGVDVAGSLSPAAIERTWQAVEDYAEHIRDTGAVAVRMVATSASRDADNADTFIDGVVARLGVVPEVISGHEEAALSFAGAASVLDTEGTVAVVDIGGGSTEFVVGEVAVGASISENVGCVRMTERHLRSDPPRPRRSPQPPPTSTRRSCMRRPRPRSTPPTASWVSRVRSRPWRRWRWVCPSTTPRSSTARGSPPTRCMR